jgi:hypothetical protein
MAGDEVADLLLGEVTTDVAGKALPSAVGQQLQYLWRGSVLLAREGGAALALSHPAEGPAVVQG